MQLFDPINSCFAHRTPQAVCTIKHRRIFYLLNKLVGTLSEWECQDICVVLIASNALKTLRSLFSPPFVYNHNKLSSICLWENRIYHKWQLWCSICAASTEFIEQHLSNAVQRFIFSGVYWLCCYFIYKGLLCPHIYPRGLFYAAWIIYDTVETHIKKLNYKNPSGCNLV